MPKQHNDIEFICFTTPDYSRVVKVQMSQLHTIRQGYPSLGDPVRMAPSIPVRRAVELYNLHVKRKVKSFTDAKEAQQKLWNVLYKKAVKPEEQDLKRQYKTVKDIPKPNTYCKVVSPRDPYDTSQKLTRTDKMPMATKNIERMKEYENIETIQDVLDKGVLSINDIKYDIKLGYVTKS